MSARGTKVAKDTSSGHPWLRGFVSLALVALLLSWVDLGEMSAVMADADRALLLLGFLLFIPDRVFAAYRWYVLLRHYSRDITLWAVTRLIFISNFLGVFLPGSVGVEVVRIYGLAKSTANLAFALSSVLVERVLALFALFVLLFVGLMLAASGRSEATAPVAILSFVGLGLLCAASLNDGLRRLTLRSMPRVLRSTVGAKLERLYRCLDDYRDRPRLMSYSSVLGLLFQTFRIWHVYVLGTALGINVPFTSFLLVIPAVRLTAMLPISIAGIGVREAGYVFMLGHVGVPPKTALALSLLMFGYGLLWNLAGAWFYARRTVAA